MLLASTPFVIERKANFMKNVILVTLVMLAANTTYAAKAMNIVVEGKAVSLQTTFKTINLASDYLRVTDKGQLVLKTEEMNQEVAIVTLESSDGFSSAQVRSKNPILVNVITDETNRDFDLFTCVRHMGCLPIPTYAKSRDLALELKTEAGKIVCYESREMNGDVVMSKWSLGRCQ